MASLKHCIGAYLTLQIISDANSSSMEEWVDYETHSRFFWLVVFRSDFDNETMKCIAMMP